MSFMNKWIEEFFLYRYKYKYYFNIDNGNNTGKLLNIKQKRRRHIIIINIMSLRNGFE